MSKKSTLLVILVCALGSVLIACGSVNSNQKEESDYYLYYVDKDETKLVREAYVPKAWNQDGLIKEFIVALDKDPKNISYRKAKPDAVILKEYTFTNGQLILDFDTNYAELKGIGEVLTRAAIVKTFCQIDGIDSVEFQVAGVTLRDKNEKPIGAMTGEDFIDNTGGETKYKQNAKITLFFANEKGDKLVESNYVVTYNGTIPMEQLIIEQLIAVPREDNKKATIPEGTKLLKATTKEGICYLDFNEKFLNKINGVTNDVTIYSIVNSLVEMPTINKVQFKINGELTKKYGDKTTFDGMFERNLDLVETTQ